MLRFDSIFYSRRLRGALLIAGASNLVLTAIWFLASLEDNDFMPFSWVLWITAIAGLFGLLFYKNLWVENWMLDSLSVPLMVFSIFLSNSKLYIVLVVIGFLIFSLYSMGSKDPGAKPTIHAGIWFLVISSVFFVVSFTLTDIDWKYSLQEILGKKTLEGSEDLALRFRFMSGSLALVGAFNITYASIRKVFLKITQS